MDFFKFLSSFSQVETAIGLLSFIVAAFLGYLAYQNNIKVKSIGRIVEKADTQSKADLAVALAGVLPSYRLPELTKQQGFEVIKLQLEQREKEFKAKGNLLKTSIILLFVLILFIIGRNYFNFSGTKIESSGPQSGISIGNNNTTNYNNTIKDTLH